MTLSARPYIYTTLCLMIGLMSALVIQPSRAQVNSSYQANGGIMSIWNSIVDDFVTIQAKKRVGQDLDTSMFARLYTNMSTIIPRLPQKSTFKITYEQCKLLSQQLAGRYSYDGLETFIDQCYTPLNSIFRDISANYTIKPKIKASPTAGSSPVTVTLDARESTDPSNETIPSGNFFWYYKNTRGQDVMIGSGSVVKTTLIDPGVYYVRLTARSVNGPSQGIMDGEGTVVINVSPEVANLVVYTQGKKMSDKNYTKVGTRDAQAGLRLDPSATQAKGGREIISHHREITGPNSFAVKTDEMQGAPAIYTAMLPNNGTYTVMLAIIDNENNTLSKKFLLTVSDPIASIKQNITEPTTQSMIMFDASTSYSIQSRIKTYMREVYNDAGDRLFVTQSKSISKQFDTPGTYTVKLTVTDELGQQNTETQMVFVDSSAPSAQFTSTSRLEWEYPSQFTLDAGSSYDRDVPFGDSLSYRREFSDPSSVTIDQSFLSGKQVLATFNNPGTYKATLTVSDSYGKVNTISKDIIVKSSLRPIVLASPRATSRGQTILFYVRSNDPLIQYEWDFGDGSKQIVQKPTITHSYARAGTYHPKVTVYDRRDQKNSITTPIFIGERDLPIGAYTVTNGGSSILKPTAKCEDVDAYSVYRGTFISVDTSESVNTQGDKKDVISYFQPENGEITKGQRITHQFKKLGCTYMDIITEDTRTTKNDRVRIRFVVNNNLPTMGSIALTFPQFGNDTGIGFNKPAATNNFDPTKFKLLSTKVSLNGPKDIDGFISNYTWYYYKKDDPSRLLEIKTTPGTIPYTFFTLVPEPGDYAFGVRIEDNEGGVQASEDIIGLGPTVFIPPLGDNTMDVPIVTLTIDKTTINVGDTVTLFTKSRVLSQRPDFEAKRTLRYDFDGDGIRDLTTKDTTITHIYTKPYPKGVTPRVEVSYRGYPVSTTSDKLYVTKTLSINGDVQVIDKHLLFRDSSYGDILSRKICYTSPTTDCVTYPAKGDVDEKFYATYTYKEYGSYTLVYYITDKYGNALQKKIPIVVTKTPSSTPRILSSPALQTIGGKTIIGVGETIQFAPIISLVGEGCWMDTDTAQDSDINGTPIDDKDIRCGETKKITYKPIMDHTIARLYRDDPATKKTTSSDIMIQIIGPKTVIPQDKLPAYNTLNSLYTPLSTSSGDENRTIAAGLVKNLMTETATQKDPTSSILAIKSYIAENPKALTTSESETLTKTISSLSTATTKQSQGINVYDNAKARIMEIVPGKLVNTIDAYRAKVDEIQDKKGSAKAIHAIALSMIASLRAESVPSIYITDAANIDKIDEKVLSLTVVPARCEVYEYYSFDSSYCSELTSSLKSGSSSISSIGSSGLGGILKRVAIIVGGIGGVVLLIILGFGIKNRLQRQDEEEEHDDDVTA